MTTLNEVFEKYGLKSLSDPTNDEIKRAISVFAYHSFKTGGEVRFEDTAKGMKAILLGKQLISRECYQALQVSAGDIHVKNAKKFNEKFDDIVGFGSAPSFLLEMIIVKFSYNYLKSFLNIERRLDDYVEVIIGKRGQETRKAVENYFTEEKIKGLFLKEESERKEEQKYRELIGGEIDSLRKKIYNHSMLGELKDDLLEYIHQLVLELKAELS